MNPNTMVTVDLDIDNYSLEDILNLFRLSEAFDEADLKKAKQYVLRIHPDKSRLEPKYFLFYSKAYKTLYSIWEFKNRSEKKSGNTENYTPLNVGEEDKKRALNTFIGNKGLKDVNNFNKWFNEEFEKQKVSNDDNENGYGSWLKSDDGIDDTNITNLREMDQHIQRRKKEARSLVVHQGITDMTSQSVGGSSLLESDDTYSSGMFSSVGFQDLKQAHEESVIPVTDEDYQNVKKFQNVNEYMNYRNKQQTVPLSEIQAHQYLAQREKQESITTTKRAYELAKQSERSKENNDAFWGKILKIENKST